MSELTAKQRAHLKSLAHPLKPVQHIGKEGVSAALVASVESALQNRELIKIKVLEAAPGSARELGAELADALPDSHLVQVIGRTVVLYRRHPDEPEIELPRGR